VASISHPGARCDFQILCDTFGKSRGGIELHAQNLAEGLRSLGHSTTIRNSSSYMATGPGFEHHLIVEGVHRVSLMQLVKHALLRPARRPLSATIFTHGSFYEESHLRSRLAVGVDSALPHILGVRIFDSAVMSKILLAFDQIAVMCDAEGADLRGLFPLTAGRLFTSPNAWSDGPLTLGSDFLTPIPQPYLFAASRVETRKNFEAVFKAIDGLDIGFILAGQDAGGLKRVLRCAANHPAVKFAYLGYLEESRKLAIESRALATVLPSRVEGIPFAVIESLRLGVPAIVTSESYLPRWPGVYPCKPDPDGIRTAIHSVSAQLTQPLPPPIPSLASVCEALVDRLV
jgi:glycosyltransferase involved in cell wall biosynthesis